MENNINFEVAIIGGGPGGYVAAIRAAQLGLNVALIEKERLGGVCLNWGCIPTKTLLRSAEVLDLIHEADKLGIDIKSTKIVPNLAKMVERSRSVADTLSNGIAMLMKKNKIMVINGEASFISGNKLKIDTDIVQADNIVIATGGRARQLPGFESDGQTIMSYKEVLVEKNIPAELLVVGAGAIGIEFASFYNALGSKVTVIETCDRILRNEDEEICTIAQKAFEARGIKFCLNAQLSGVKKSSKGVVLSIKSEGKDMQLNGDKMLMSIGIVANIETLALQNAGVVVENGRIRINNECQTNIPNIYAIGDVACTNPCLAHKASHEGLHAIEIIAQKMGKFNGHIPKIDYTSVPACTYTSPQIASVGLTQKVAEKLGYKVKVGKFKPIGNGKAIAMGETTGLIKVIFDEKTGAIVGAHMLGAEVTEMIQGFVIAKNGELTEAELMHTIFPHPTMSEMMYEATLDAYGRAIHS